MIIVALSGGKASAWCAGWAVREYGGIGDGDEGKDEDEGKGRDEVVLYFNDTKWEHRDLYRFVREVGEKLGARVVVDADGRSPEKLFYDKHALANDRMPFCSVMLKADRLQKFYRDGDTLVFGIGLWELERAKRLVERYEEIGKRTGKWCKLTFPLIKERVEKEEIDRWLGEMGIVEPELYRLGFQHNNCSGGCVRGGKKQWKRLLRVLPEVFAERERVEEEFREWSGRDVTFIRGMRLRELRDRVVWEDGVEELRKKYGIGVGGDDMRDVRDEEDEEDEGSGECFGVCSNMA